jgi:hypothetical protein
MSWVHKSPSVCSILGNINIFKSPKNFKLTTYKLQVNSSDAEKAIILKNDDTLKVTTLLKNYPIDTIDIEQTTYWIRIIQGEQMFTIGYSSHSHSNGVGSQTPTFPSFRSHSPLQKGTSLETY